ncbi:hypothetical protein [Nonomuraea rhizosphaerae]|uniref:hypothetical protein n=1 Tax=Nonomuraea rhizosphaerae TaxID=2665663 RepID=UPI001C5F752E|nr:hypothetical protein [Nonomuraea rhizosphaerae]
MEKKSKLLTKKKSDAPTAILTPPPKSAALTPQQQSQRKRKRAQSIPDHLSVPDPKKVMGAQHITLVPGARVLPLGAKVKVKPQFDLTHDGRIDGIHLSSLQRTPSPFGKAMGDHTVAWQAVVDSVRAMLHGKSIPEAVGALRAMQLEAQAWMSNSDSLEFALFSRLNDTITRAPRLENAAFEVEALCQAALNNAAADPAKAVGNLADAIAQHLAYLNYLPFATVPASQGGRSTGVNEGLYRKRLLAFEREGGALGEDQRALLEQALWKLFSFDAAIRESHIALLIDPTIAQATVDAWAELESCANELSAAMYGDDSNPVNQLNTQLAKLKNKAGTTQAIFDAAGELIKTADRYLDMRSETGLEAAKALDAARSTMAERILTDIVPAKASVDLIKERLANAPERVAEVLPYLLHDHQRRMAAAYARSVSETGFLYPDDQDNRRAEHEAAADSAVDALKAALKESFPDLFTVRMPNSSDSDTEEAEEDEPQALKGLLDKIKESYLTLSRIVVPESSPWVVSAARSELIVTYVQGGRPAFIVNGRAPAPSGVAGQGNHSTAWAIEQQHPDALISKATSVDEAVGILKQAVIGDLGSPVMELDALLPFAQIEGGQVLDIYKAAVAVLKAMDVEEAATAYLKFRNLLPYATVDPGDRTGHNERKDGDVKVTFDGKALQEAVELKNEELTKPTDEERNDHLASVRAAVEALDAEAQTWKDNPPLDKAVLYTKERLSAMAQLVAKKETANLTGGIYQIRQKEHVRVWEQVQEYRQTLPTPPVK